MGSRITLGAFLRGQTSGDRPSFARADEKLAQMKDYLNRAVHSLRSRRAYIVPSGMWSYNAQKRRIEIDKDYYPRMAADMTEQLESNGRKPEAAPSITSEFAYAFSDERILGDARSSHSPKVRAISILARDSRINRGRKIPAPLCESASRPSVAVVVG